MALPTSDRRLPAFETFFKAKCATCAVASGSLDPLHASWMRRGWLGRERRALAATARAGSVQSEFDRVEHKPHEAPSPASNAPTPGTAMKIADRASCAGAFDAGDNFSIAISNWLAARSPSARSATTIVRRAAMASPIGGWCSAVAITSMFEGGSEEDGAVKQCWDADLS